MQCVQSSGAGAKKGISLTPYIYSHTSDANAVGYIAEDHHHHTCHQVLVHIHSSRSITPPSCIKYATPMNAVGCFSCKGPCHWARSMGQTSCKETMHKAAHQHRNHGDEPKDPDDADGQIYATRRGPRTIVAVHWRRFAGAVCPAAASVVWFICHHVWTLTAQHLLIVERPDC